MQEGLKKGAVADQGRPGRAHAPGEEGGGRANRQKSQNYIAEIPTALGRQGMPNEGAPSGRNCQERQFERGATEKGQARSPSHGESKKKQAQKERSNPATTGSWGLAASRALL